MLMLKQLEVGGEALSEDKAELEKIVGPLSACDCDKINGVLMGAMQDADFYGMSPEERLVLICCLIPEINHEYVLFEVVEEFGSE